MSAYIFIYFHLLYLLLGLILWSLSNVFVSCNNLYFKVVFLIWVLLHQLSLHLHEIAFAFPWFQTGCVPKFERVSYRQYVYGSCFSIHSTRLCLLAGAFNLFAFKVTDNIYVLIATLLIVLDLFLWAFFFSVFCLEKLI